VKNVRGWAVGLNRPVRPIGLIATDAAVLGNGDRIRHRTTTRSTHGATKKFEKSLPKIW
tara:strand:- start:38 stop:214 length:177 start_codon:yes stop_codon:yes gene_type:complete